MTYPCVCSLDIETFGACETDWRGRPLPLQTTFHPARMIAIDGVDPSQILLTCALTLPTSDPRPTPATPWTIPLLSQLKPGPTLLLNLWDEKHLHTLLRWLRHCDTLLGTNLPYDLLCLRAHPLLRHIIDGSHFLIDLTVINFLHNSGNLGRSLKTIRRFLSLHPPDQDDAPSLRDGHRFPSPLDPAHRSYNADDTHSTLLSLAELAARITHEQNPPCTSSSPSSSSSSAPSCGAPPNPPAPHPGAPDLLRPFILTHYSSLLWTTIRMGISGIPLSVPSLTALRDRCLSECATAEALCFFGSSLLLSGEGSAKSKDAFLATTLKELTTAGHHVPAHPLFELTDKRAKPKWSSVNRSLLLAHFPADSDTHVSLTQSEIHATASKLLSTYLYPLLHGSRAHLAKAHDLSLKGKPPCPIDRTELLTPSLESLWSHPCTSLSLLPSCPSPISPAASSPAPPCTAPSPSSPASSSTSSAACPTLWDPASTSPTSTPAAPPPNTATTTPSTDILYAWPSWFVTPSFTNDASGDGGGQVQIRISAKKPAAQTWPQSIKDCMTSRFGAAGRIVSFDLSQIELRTAALLSGDEALCSAYLNDLDLHTDRTIAVLSRPWLLERCGDPLSKHNSLFSLYRQVGKRMNFADLYLASPHAMQFQVFKETGLFLPLTIFQNVEASRPHLRPGLWSWQQEMQRLARRDGRLTLPLTGAHRDFPGTTHYNEIVNYPIQAHAAFTFHRLLSLLCDTLPPLPAHRAPCHLILEVHDAAYFDCHISFIPTLSTSISRALLHLTTTDYWAMLSTHYGRTVPLTLDFHPGDPP